MDLSFFLYVGIGFAAQIVDGALGMAYGTVSTSILLLLGLPPATVSATVHTAQFFTTGLSGFFHTIFHNVKWRLCLVLSVAGIIGGVTGAVVLTQLDGKALRPWIAAYLLVLGLSIIRKVFEKKPEGPAPAERRACVRVSLLGLTGGFFDSIGGGGWGPIVTSHLIAGREEPPRFIIGTVNTAEFFVKTAIAATLVALIGLDFQYAVLGLLTGGILAAPAGAYVLRHVRPERLMLLVGILISGLSLWQVIQALL